MKNVVLIGSGGREHAIAYKIAQSRSLAKLFIIPGNPGTKLLGENINLNPDNKGSILEFCLSQKIDLVIIGPEKPLVNGLADFLRENKILVFGPDKNAAAIEGSKVFAKHLMKKYNIPSAEYRKFSSGQNEEAKEYLKSTGYPLVLKADGLAAGKGVIICNNSDEALSSLNEIFEKKIFGDAGEKIIIEEFLEGEEASIFAVTDGENFVCLPSAQDHKRAGDNDTGKNTGGMGAYSPAPIITENILKEIKQRIISPTLNALIKENRRFVGCLYCGLMITKEGPKVIEFNCRFGDPETQVVLPLLEGDFLELLYSAASGNLNMSSIIFSGGSSVCVVAASEGYPDKYQTGYEIKGLNHISNKEDIIVFHAGTKEEDGKIFTNGGRVLGITSVLRINDLKLAKQICYDALDKIYYNNIYFRKDIADKALNRVEVKSPD